MHCFVSGVPTFRKVLQRTLNAVTVQPSALERVYIPNLLGVPFELTEKFVSAVHRVSGSTVCADVLKNWDTASGSNARTAAEREQKRAELCRLLLIELLAYQFASPVCWIQTTKALVKMGIKRFIEIGPSAVLLPMFTKAYESLLPLSSGQYQMLWSGRNSADIFMEEEGKTKAEV
jgi:fatty acid synthase